MPERNNGSIPLQEAVRTIQEVIAETGIQKIDLKYARAFVYCTAINKLINKGKIPNLEIIVPLDSEVFP